MPSIRPGARDTTCGLLPRQSGQEDARGSDPPAKLNDVRLTGWVQVDVDGALRRAFRFDKATPGQVQAAVLEALR